MKIKLWNDYYGVILNIEYCLQDSFLYDGEYYIQIDVSETKNQQIRTMAHYAHQMPAECFDWVFDVIMKNGGWYD